MDYVQNIKAKYGIKVAGEKHKFFTPEDYQKSQNKLQVEIKKFFQEYETDYEKLMKKIYKNVVSSKKFKILELWENPVEGTLFWGLKKNRFGPPSIIKGYIIESNPRKIVYKLKLTDSQHYELSRMYPIFVKFSPSQLKVLKMLKI